VGAVALQIELGFEGLIDRLDGLAQRLEVPGARPLALAVAGRAQQLQPASHKACSNRRP
jgi:hypothetical protein